MQTPKKAVDDAKKAASSALGKLKDTATSLKKKDEDAVNDNKKKCNIL